ncbi:hypothetical protein CAEBREN_10614 [Caenorhabditis brenneri]|uniref:Uncharacterized protein n=1 Tax=Caenorhabditis brenneri TaxID=135651 RepID=G0M9N5_CAEBE|nr:hypothetical protein CAEBREN_10614 [Caenorhabditis brenneri]
MKSVAEIAGLGGFVKAFIVFMPVKPDPILAKLKELDAKIDGIASKMSHHFNDMKAFMTELNFYVEVITPTSKLTKFMLDCLNNPTKNAKENFEKEYNKQTPLSIAYTLIGYLEQKSTNPLIMAMNADRLKTRATFEKWQGIIDGVLGQFLFLEAFASGLLKEKNQYDTSQLMKRSNALLGEIENWKNDYKTSGHYWDGLRQYLDEFAATYKNWGHGQMADELQRKLETILTNDSMRIFVGRYDENLPYGYHSKYNNIVMMKLIPKSWFGWGDGTSIVILRSTNGASLRAEKYTEARKKITAAHRNGVFSFINYKQVGKKVFDECFPESDVVLAVPGYVFPEWRSVNWNRSDAGPGAIEMVEVDCPPCRGCMEVYVGLA